LRVSQHCYALCGFEDMVNAGFVAGTESLAVIDTTMSPHSAETLLGCARALFPELPITLVINTHWHSDHVFGNQVFSGTGATIASHIHTQVALRNSPDYPAIILGLMKQAGRGSAILAELLADVNVIPPDMAIEQQQTFDLGGVTLEVRHLPGHTKADLAVFVPQDKVVFAGDLLYTAGRPHVKFGHPGIWAESLARMLEWDFTTVVPGHGRLGGREDVRKQGELLGSILPRARQLWESGADAAAIGQELRIHISSMKRIMGIIADGLLWPSFPYERDESKGEAR